MALSNSFAHRLHVHLALALCLLWHTVGDECHTAAFLFLEKMHTIAHSIHHLNEIFAQLWIVIVNVAAMEVAHVLAILALLGRSFLLEPRLKLAA